MRIAFDRRTRSRLVGALAIVIIMAVSVVIGGLAAGYRPVVIQTGSMGETAPPKSLIIAVPRDASEVFVGDIIVMRRPGSTPVTHRIIEIEQANESLFAITQGDANEAPDAAPYPLAGEELISRWILPGWGGVIQSIFQPGIALGVVVLATLVLAYQALRTIWSKPTAPVLSAVEDDRPPVEPSSDGRRIKRRWAFLLVPAVGLLTAGVAWALFVSTDSVASNNFTTAACFDAQLGSVQSGETIHAVDGAVNVPITPVDPTGSFVMASLRSASNEPADSVVQVELVGGGTSVQLTRATDAVTPGPVTVAWSVVEYSCGVTVERGTINGDGTAQLDIGVGPVDTGASFVLVSTAPETWSADFDADDLFIGELTSPTNLRIRTSGSVFDNQRTFAWQVVSFDDPADAVVQTVTGSLGVGVSSTTVAVPMPTDRSTTFLLTNGVSASSGNDIGERLVRTHLVDASTIELTRGVGSDPIDVSIQVVNLKDGSSVRHGTVDFSTGQPTRTIAIEPVDPSRSTAISTVAIPGVTGGGLTDHISDDVVGEATATFTLADPVTLSVNRDATASNASFGWQVIEWAGPQWWDPNYTFRQRIDVDTSVAAAPDAYTVPLLIDHAALVTTGLSRTDGNDLRVVRWDGSTWSELHRVLDDASTWNLVDSTMWFRTVDPIPADSTSTYWLYLGNPSPPPPLADPELVYLLSEDFESGTLGDFEDRTGGTGWYVAAPWLRRIPVTIPAGRVGTDLSDFPLLVSLSHADLSANAQADGSDIRFTAADGTTPLDHEIEGWDSGTGSLDAWVRVPTLTSSAATTVYLYYGAADAPAQEDVRATWAPELQAVWHLARDPGGSAPQLDDSTVSNHDGLGAGSMNATDLVAGLVGDALDFDGTDDYVQSDPFDIVGAGGLTLSGWVRLDAYSNHGRVIAKADGPANRIFELSISNTGGVRGRISLGGSTQELEVGAGVVSIGAWHHVASTWDGGTLRLFVDAVEIGSLPASGVVDSDPSMPVTIGGLVTSGGMIDGLLDEVRVETVARSTAWLAGTESNQRSPATFHVVGAVENGSWFDQGAWAFRKPIATDSDLVTADVTDFPLLVKVVDAELQSSALASAADIVFTDADGTTRLDHVVETWDSGTGALSAWVSVPLLSSTSDNQLFVYYGNAGAIDQQDPIGVFGPGADLVFLGAGA